MNNIMYLILIYSCVFSIFAILGLIEKIPYIDSKLTNFVKRIERSGKNDC